MSTPPATAMSKCKLTAATLPTATNQPEKCYHICADADHVSHSILLCGDPGRAVQIADRYFLSREFTADHRGLTLITGQVSLTKLAGSTLKLAPSVTVGTEEPTFRVTVATSGMGTPSLEIVVNELIILNEIKLPERMRLEHRREMLNIIRVGTSGAVRQETPLGTAIITKYALGMDNTGLFYDSPVPNPVVKKLEEDAYNCITNATPTTARFRGKIFPYVSMAHPDVVHALEVAATSLQVQRGLAKPLHKTGITVTNSGFFANQGRDIHPTVSPTVPVVDYTLSNLTTIATPEDPEVCHVENFEMEAAFLHHLCSALGYHSGTICAAIANRVLDTFVANSAEVAWDAIDIALRALALLDGKLLPL
ncbi:uridine phosphorylase [Pelomyxa schiedti]|nr:uridine phosphorylase [Pelomyxa schiedti]